MTPNQDAEFEKFTDSIVDDISNENLSRTFHSIDSLCKGKDSAIILAYGQGIKKGAEETRAKMLEEIANRENSLVEANTQLCDERDYALSKNIAKDATIKGLVEALEKCKAGDFAFTIAGPVNPLAEQKVWDTDKIAQQAIDKVKGE